MLTAPLRTTRQPHLPPSPSFLCHIDCQVDISVSVVWHLADWTEVSGTAITGQEGRAGGGRKENTEQKKKTEEEGCWKRQREGAESEWAGGIEAKEEREKELSYSPLSQRSAVFQMPLFTRHHSVHINWNGVPLSKLLLRHSHPAQSLQVNYTRHHTPNQALKYHKHDNTHSLVFESKDFFFFFFFILSR